MTWHDWYMNIAATVATKSKDPKRKVGCVIADRQWLPRSFGYNGFPRGFPDTPENWTAPEKNKYIIHAEENAILNARSSLEDCVLYSTTIPCLKCCGRIVQTGINLIVTNMDEIAYPEEFADIKYMLDKCGVTLLSHVPSDVILNINMSTKSDPAF